MAGADRPSKPETGSENLANHEASKSEPGHGTSNAAPQSKPRVITLSNLKRLWKKTGIDWRTYESMFRGALAPTIAVACFQATDFADIYTTQGYLVGIATVLSVVIAPRAKFVQTMLINVIFVCTAAAVVLLGMFCIVKARQNSVGNQGPGQGGAGTSGEASSGTETARYNSSASAVSGVWLFFEIYVVSVIRGKNPAYTVPCILCAIFANVASVYAPQFSEMAQAELFAWHLLRAFLTGFAIATGVSLFIFPLTCRQIVFKSLSGYISTLRGAMQANLQYLKSLESADMFSTQRTATSGTHQSTRSPEAYAFKAKMHSLSDLHAKLATDLPFAKREVAFGRLGPDDIQAFFAQLRFILIPTVGLSCMSDIFDVIAEERGWDRSQNFAQTMDKDLAPDSREKLRIEIIDEWHELIRQLREPFGHITSTIDEGLQHVAITMRFAPAPKNNGDIEAQGTEPRPGLKGFTAIYERHAREFLKSKETMLRGWCHMHGIELPENFFEDPDRTNFQAPDWMQEGILSNTQRRLRRQLFLCLYMEFLLYNIARQTYQLMLLADGFRDSGKLSRTRLVVPGLKRMRKWVVSLLAAATDSHGDGDVNAIDDHHTTVYLGQAYKARRDPEHLPPENAWERCSDQLRKVAHFLKSPASIFGFRVACATMCVAIVAFLKDTQVFFTTQRLFWAQIMVSISMSPTAGQSLKAFLLRITGTAIAMLLSWIAWYIVDEHTAGILVFFFVFIHLGPWILLKHPQYRTVGMISQITMVLCIGYELQARKLGIAAATSNGQAYHPIYILGPIRLATVSSGVFVGWIWTVFPYPISEHNQMRKNLSSALYLLANYYSIMHETVRIRVKDEETNIAGKDDPSQKLDKARRRTFMKANLAISGLRAQCGFLKFDIPIGGRFPRERYQRIVDDLQRLLDYMALVSVASKSFTELQEQGDQGHGMEWLANFRKLAGDANVTTQQVTTLLSLLSASVMSGQPLPPYLRVPEAYMLAQKLDALDKDILSVRHIAEPGYSSFAVIQIGTKCIIDDMKRLVNGVRELVGELDFSYHIVSAADVAKNDSTETLVYTKDSSRHDLPIKQD